MSDLTANLAELHEKGRQKDSIGRLAARTHLSARQIVTILDYHRIPKTARDRAERTIIELNA
jgi:hypothetical protein